jgi:phospholipase C
MPPTQPGPSRRTFLGATAATAATAGLLGALPTPAAASTPARRRKGSLDDIEHVVILMQENRSVDHYYGTMRGVRGFGDKAALQFANGRTVFQQPDPRRTDGGYLLPWHVDTAKVDGQDLSGNDHSWGGVHLQWANGDNTGYVTETGENSVAYFDAGDVPFNRALAKAFTFCDHYFCSIKGPTTPNRLFHWSGTIDPHGTAGGPAIFNPDDYNPVYRWTTYPERLESAGISWQLFANDEVGDGGGEDGWVGDYGDNPLWLFQAYHDALASSDPAVRRLAERASLRTQWKPNSGQGRDVNHVLAQFLAACASGSLPAVTWIVAPYAYSEHPAARPIDGAAYTQTVLNAIWAQPGLWEKTAVFINYDEHDGFFDHLISPTAPPGTPDEFVNGLPVGLGPRVPMTVVSPWSRGGWINSEVLDHTSVLRFLELWTGVKEPNISAWRRSICGDLTSCFDFGREDTTIPLLPDTAALRKQADELESKLPVPAPPAPGEQVVPPQEPGTAPARPLPYQPWGNATHDAGAVQVTLGNAGSAAVQLQVYDRATGLPAQRIDVAAGSTASAALPAPLGYDVAVHGPNGFLREIRGGADTNGIEVAATLTGPAGHPLLALTFTNSTPRRVTLVVSGLDGREQRLALPTGARTVTADPIAAAHGWYDIGVSIDGSGGYLRRFAGHLENGRGSSTG